MNPIVKSRAHVYSVGILIFDGVEVLDAFGPFEVFSVANRISLRRLDHQAFSVSLIGVNSGNYVKTRGGMRVLADIGIDETDGFDLLIIPGGVIDGVVADPTLISWLCEMRKDTSKIASVCNGIFLLHAAGMLDHRPVTTHWEDIECLKQKGPNLVIRENARFIDHGNIATSAGISAGIDMSLHFVKTLLGAAFSKDVARQMELDPLQHQLVTQESLIPA